MNQIRAGLLLFLAATASGTTALFFMNAFRREPLKPAMIGKLALGIYASLAIVAILHYWVR